MVKNILDFFNCTLKIFQLDRTILIFPPYNGPPKVLPSERREEGGGGGPVSRQHLWRCLFIFFIKFNPTYQFIKNRMIFFKFSLH